MTKTISGNSLAREASRHCYRPAPRGGVRPSPVCIALRTHKAHPRRAGQRSRSVDRGPHDEAHADREVCRQRRGRSRSGCDRCRSRRRTSVTDVARKIPTNPPIHCFLYPFQHGKVFAELMQGEPRNRCRHSNDPTKETNNAQTESSQAESHQAGQCRGRRSGQPHPSSRTGRRFPMSDALLGVFTRAALIPHPGQR